MISSRAVIFSVLLGVTWATEYQTFPAWFKFGAASSAYQVEGGWNASDKGESIWDRFVHERPEVVADGTNGDVACDSYHLWRRDVEMAAELGLDFYRFSIAWSRILPSGFDNYVSEHGKNYYNNLIDGLLEKGIEPVVTLYHWDLPQSLQDLGGWLNPLVADWFSNYARVVYSLYGDRVKTWVTINEPLVVCDGAYNLGSVAPAIVDLDNSMYLCNKNLLLAHAKAWRVYDEEFRAVYHGAVSLSNHLIWFEGEDQGLVDLILQYSNGRYSYPIFSKEGGWPPSVEEAIAKKSIKQGHSKSKLPAFTDEEIQLIKGTYDFFGVNHYFSRTVRASLPGEEGVWLLHGAADLDVMLENPPDAEYEYAGLGMSPKALRHTLNWIRDQYGDVEILITENGCSSTDAGLDDGDRVQFYQRYLDQLLLAMKEDGVNVSGFTAWTLMDNFEWNNGYLEKFGLYAVDFSSEERTRTPRASAHYYADVIRTRSTNVTL